MSAALAQFSDTLSPLLMQQGDVGIGPLLPQDTASLFAWMNDISALKQDASYRPFDGPAFASWLEGFSKDRSQVLFIIRQAGNAQASGFVFLRQIHPIHRSAEFGIRVGREADRGRGIGRAATTLALDYAWRHLNLVRVHLQVLAGNARAVRAYEAAGFAIEGRHAHAAFIAGEWHDMLTMAVLNPSLPRAATH